ncbi:hypothetical protein Dsin_004077 [Dipteronia sinensis]|uniref:Uncharacterized protein n=1 Tax=Dipteronia sinensis TaxID=43782 RepID=A0AAE0B8S0_9ROSI|nr:hypothetical protein Dsin_004077 [Dipteronia sinensis]
MIASYVFQMKAENIPVSSTYSEFMLKNPNMHTSKIGKKKNPTTIRLYYRHINPEKLKHRKALERRQWYSSSSMKLELPSFKSKQIPLVLPASIFRFTFLS